MLYPAFKVNKKQNKTGGKIWGTLRNIEEDVRWAQKKEGQEKKIKKNNF